MAKDKTPKGEKRQRTIPFKLNDEQKARKGEEAAKLAAKIDEAVDLKKAEMSKHNVKIKEMTKKLSDFLKAINEGVERKPVTCTEVKNFNDDVVEYWFEGEVRETRKMTPEDRQTEMKIAKKTEEKWQKLAPKNRKRGDPLTTGEEAATEEQEIAQVHKLETSRKGASSAVDNKTT
jgi:hypothetical protein